MSCCSSEGGTAAWWRTCVTTFAESRAPPAPGRRAIASDLAPAHDGPSSWPTSRSLARLPSKRPCAAFQSGQRRPNLHSSAPILDAPISPPCRRLARSRRPRGRVGVAGFVRNDSLASASPTDLVTPFARRRARCGESEDARAATDAGQNACRADGGGHRIIGAAARRLHGHQVRWPLLAATGSPAVGRADAQPRAKAALRIDAPG